MGTYTAMGNFGSIAGSFFYGGTLLRGYWLCFAMSVATAVLSLANCLALRAVNRHRDKLYGKPIPGVPIDVTENGDQNKMFRMIT